MDTPICDFVKKYAEKNSVRAHMPGHKAEGFLGVEHLDITEFDGADNLFSPTGIIKKSMDNAGEIFGANTFYSTEGSSLSIKAMLYLVYTYAKNKTEKPYILAGRNAHSSFVNACALIGFDTIWLYGKNHSYLSCDVSATDIDDTLCSLTQKPIAVYLTSPDYVGNVLDIESISNVCDKHGVFLLVDNAHGAYLKFLEKSRHPIDLGATMCCDSAHKTLPALTGASYVHISKSAPDYFKENVLSALALFGSTSPSYLILQSLDKLNLYLQNRYKNDLKECVERVDDLKYNLEKLGHALYGQEKIKVSIKTKNYGYSGQELNKILSDNNIICEFYDDDFVVLMLSPQTRQSDFERIKNVFSLIERKQPLEIQPPKPVKVQTALTIRQAFFSTKEIIPIDKAEGRIMASPCISCPPAVPIIVSGEVVDKEVISAMKYYGVKHVSVVK